MHLLSRCTSPNSSRSPLGRLLTNAIQSCDPQLTPKHFSYYMHPERMKQKIKEKDALKLCKYFDSPEYKSRVASFLELQHKLLTQGTPIGLSAKDLKYEHVLSCAQPKQKKVTTIVEPASEPKKKRKAKLKITSPPKFRTKTTALEEILRRRSTTGITFESPNITEEVEEEQQKSTILPILLNAQEAKLKKKYRQKTTIMPIYLRKMKKNREQQEVLSKMREKYNNNVRQYAEKELVEEEGSVDVDDLTENVSADWKQEQVNSASKTTRSSTPTKSNSRTMGTLAKRQTTPRNIKQQLGIETEENMPDSQMNINKYLENNYERNAIIDAIRTKNNKGKYIGSDKDPVMSLFQRVKTESGKQPKAQTIHPFDIEVSFSRPERVRTPTSIVSNTRLKREANLKEKARQNPGFWTDSVKQTKRTGLPVGETDEDSYELRLVSKNLARSFHKKLPRNIVDATDGRSSTSSKKYLIKLQKTTVEGYRVLMYAVRDPDPTKMNFNDVVKAFCMYNDAVLSEDGLQEGYVVLFDMKGVSIGHLARVSLPALKCFMVYIQEAHPCRLKGIHVLNTASWIHHVMRLIVPLVKSDLLNLVRFHKGNTPSDFPVELLPREYGGEAPPVEELDRTTKELVHKYRGWLIESGLFKSDESKRAKKASWWSFLNGANKAQNELDEKAILKNLQID